MKISSSVFFFFLMFYVLAYDDFSIDADKNDSEDDIMNTKQISEKRLGWVDGHCTTVEQLTDYTYCIGRRPTKNVTKEEYRLQCIEENCDKDDSDLGHRAIVRYLKGLRKQKELVLAAKSLHKVESAAEKGISGISDRVCSSSSTKPRIELNDLGYADDYRGWYDVSECGKCDDYCRWVGLAGAGGNPHERTEHGQSRWKCIIVGANGYDQSFGVFPKSYIRCKDEPMTEPSQYCVKANPISNDDAGYLDMYRGWYDVSRCGKCNDYCRWVGESGSGGDPRVSLVHGLSFWSCRLALLEGKQTPKHYFYEWHYTPNKPYFQYLGDGDGEDANCGTCGSRCDINTITVDNIHGVGELGMCFSDGQCKQSNLDPGCSDDGENHGEDDDEDDDEDDGEHDGEPNLHNKVRSEQDLSSDDFSSDELRDESYLEHDIMKALTNSAEFSEDHDESSVSDTGQYALAQPLPPIPTPGPPPPAPPPCNGGVWNSVTQMWDCPPPPPSGYEMPPPPPYYNEVRSKYGVRALP